MRSTEDKWKRGGKIEGREVKRRSIELEREREEGW